MEQRYLNAAGMMIATIDMIATIFLITAVIKDKGVPGLNMIVGFINLIFILLLIINFIISGLLCYGIKVVKTL